MYLSKLTLNPRCREARRDMGSPYDLHQTLARAFTTDPGTDYRARHGVLFRLEPMANASALPTVLVQSATAPVWYELPETYFLQEPAAKIWQPVLLVGQTFSFRLLANPTKKEKRDGKNQGRRVALLDSSSTSVLTPAREWLARKGEQHGFQILYAVTDDFWLGTGRQSGNWTKQQLPLYGVRFDGLLQVSDPSRLAEALETGIGSAKAFGFGLLSLARPQ